MGFGGLGGGGALMGGLGALLNIGQDIAGTAVAIGEQRKAEKRFHDFYKEMRGTRYQAAVKDMLAAGLNPILAVGGGGVGAAPVGAPQPATYRAAVGGAGASAFKMGALLNAEKELKSQQVMETIAKEAQASSAADVNRQTADNVRVDTALKAAALPGARAQAELDKTQGGAYLRWVNRVIRSITGRDSTR